MGRMTTGLQDTNSSQTKADNLLTLYSVTASFVEALVGQDRKLSFASVPCWLQPTMTEAEEANQMAMLSSMMPAPQQQHPQAAKQKSMNFPIALTIVKKVYATGLSHFSTDEKAPNSPSTN